MSPEASISSYNKKGTSILTVLKFAT